MERPFGRLPGNTHVKTREKLIMKTLTDAWILPLLYGRLRSIQGPCSSRLRVLAVLVAFASVSPQVVEAAPPAADKDATADARQSESDGALSGSGKKITLDDTFTVEGTLEKPSAFYILRRSALDYDWARLDARLSPLVLESVQDPLF